MNNPACSAGPPVSGAPSAMSATGRISHRGREDDEMNGTGGGRTRSRRSGGLAGGLAAIALLATACGGAGSTALAATTAYQKALAYAQCMRAHGEPSYPDPTANGGFIIDG